MKDYQAKNIRNIAVVGHGSEGKTTLVEALLYTSGTIDRQGRVEDGNTVTDSDKEEQGRQISISAAVAPLEWKDVKVNLIDVPGYFDFAGEMVGPMAVAEGAIITVGAVSGLNVGAEKAWDMCDKTHTSRMIVINQMDRENANFSRALATITDKYGSHIAPIEVPIVEGGKFTGVVCVLENKAYTGEGKTLKEIDIPANMAGDVESAREAIMEAAAGAEDELMEKYFEEGELSPGRDHARPAPGHPGRHGGAGGLLLVADARGPCQAAGQPHRPHALPGGLHARGRQSQERRR